MKMGKNEQEGVFFKKILDNLFDGVYFCDADRKITYWNKAAEKLTGYTAEEVLDSRCGNDILVHTDMYGEKLCSNDKCPAVRSMKEKKMVEAEIYLKHKDGYRIPILTRISPIFSKTGEVAGAVEIFSDNSAKVSAFQKIEKLEELAFIDSLTGTGNRRYAEIKINAKLEESRRYAWAGNFGLLFIDIDRFKSINDDCGHAAGDAVLKSIVKTIMRSLRANDFIGRWGGEEFVVLLSDVDRKMLLTIAEKLRLLAQSLELKSCGGEKKISVSIGATLAKKDDNARRQPDV